MKDEVATDKDTIYAYMCIRANNDKPNIFYAVEELEVEVPHTDIISLATDAKTITVKKATTVRDASDNDYESHVKISVAIKSYRAFKSIASTFVPDDHDAESDDDEDEEEEEATTTKAKGRATSKARKSKKSIKKITGVKKSQSATKGRRTKKGASAT